MRIAIVDDNVTHLETLGTMLRQYAQEKNIEVEVDKFTEGFTFFDEYEKRRYDAVFLDVIMTGMTGIEIAKILRKNDKHIAIVFATTSAKNAIMGYKVSAVDYMIKPISYTNLRLTMNKLIKIHENNKEKKILQLKIEGGVVFINVEDIVYVESRRHNCIFHTQTEDYTTSLSIGALEKEYEQYHLVRCQKSYIVNLAHVKKIEGNHVCLGEDKLLIPISRDKKKLLTLKLMVYYGENI